MVGGLPRRRQGLGLHRRLLRQDGGGGEVVLHLLEGGEDRLPVGAEAFVVDGAGLPDLGADLAGLEQGHDRPGAERPDFIRRVEEVLVLRPLIPGGAGEGDDREIAGLGHPDPGGSRGQPALRPGDVGPVFELLRGNQRRRGGRLDRQIGGWQGEGRRGLSEEHRDGVFQLGPLQG